VNNQHPDCSCNGEKTPSALQPKLHRRREETESQNNVQEHGKSRTQLVGWVGELVTVEGFTGCFAPKHVNLGAGRQRARMPLPLQRLPKQR
jgi:hypothetical protein